MRGFTEYLCFDLEQNSPIRMRVMSMMAKKARLSGDEAINETDVSKEAVNA